MNKYKILVVDFDGTLVGKDFSLSLRLKDAVEKLVNQGFFFSIATGRPYWGIVKKICKELNLLSPQITSGGAEITDPKTGKILWKEYFLKEEAESLIKFFLENNYDFGIESEGFVCISKNVAETRYGPDVPKKKIEDLNYEKVAKIVLFDVAEIGDPKRIEENLGDKYKDLHFIRAGKEGTPLVLDITSAKATKHLAILELSKILNIDTELMIGVGDGYNDYPLLSVCGYKVAMENAPMELKEIADLIVPSVANDGLVTLVDKLV